MIVFNGIDARSTVRRPQLQSSYLKKAGRGTQVLKLQGFLFFGTVSAVEDRIRMVRLWSFTLIFSRISPANS